MSESDVARVLEAVVVFVRRFVVLTDDQLVALALWVFHTHAVDAGACTPYIGITSAEKRSGKTRLLEVVELLVKEALPTANISDAALFRAIAELGPTLLFDEIDAIFGPKARDREDLRGMLNAGFRHGAVVRRMGGARMTTLEVFPVYCPKAFAGIGDLPDTLADRSIRIRLERRTREEPIERFRRRDVEHDAETIRISLEALADHHLGRLAEARPHLPDELDDRAQDCWEPLLAIADLAGGDWPSRAYRAALALSSGEEREDASMGARLLQDIYDVFGANGIERYKTADLIVELGQVEESPWGDWFGKPISPQALSKLLKPYRIQTMPVWVDGKTGRGYKAEQFTDAWLRVLGVRSVRSVRSGSTSENDLTLPNGPNTEGVRSKPSVDAAPNAPNAPNTEHMWRLLSGDPGYALFVDRAYANGHLTEAEHREQIELAGFVYQRRSGDE